MNVILNVPELDNLTDSARRFFCDLVSREFILTDRIKATNGQLLDAIPTATSTRSISRWLKLIREEGLIEVKKIKIREDYFKRELSLSEKGKRVQDYIIAGSQIN
ncbi:hypothetical protein KHQ82_05355 [Mycoplasmatota bacterium]|nr:hypothetical protein KHQ82_05355 [Mycoplasmatota bacterium]